MDIQLETNVRMNLHICHHFFFTGDECVVGKVLIQISERAAQFFILPSLDKKYSRAELRALGRAKTKNALAVDAQGLQMSNYNKRVRVHHRESCLKFSFFGCPLDL